MSTPSSSLNRLRSKKITGGRVQCIVYLPKSEVEEIDRAADVIGSSRSSIIAQLYYNGKKSSKFNKQRED